MVVVDPSGTRTLFNHDNSPLHVPSLLPVTTYRIELAFLLTGSFVGLSFQITAHTLEAGGYSQGTEQELLNFSNLLTKYWKSHELHKDAVEHDHMPQV